MYKLSICIPTFNRDKILEKTLAILIEGIEKEITDSIEIIICDNASTDRTRDIIKAFIEKYTFVKYYRNKVNLGFDGNVVECIKNSNGEYIFLLSDDDIVLPGTIRNAYQNILVHKPSIICHSHYSFNGEDYLKKDRVFYPEYDKIYEHGIEFFSLTGLGFISGIVLNRSLALKYLNKVNYGKGCAHLDIASRIALNEHGKKIFIGSMPIAARAPEKQDSNYDLMKYGYIYVNQLYKDLLIEKLITYKVFKRRENGTLIKLIPKHILYERILGNKDRIESQKNLIKEEFNSNIYYYFFVLPALLMPVTIIALPYKLSHGLLIKFRRYWVNRKNG